MKHSIRVIIAGVIIAIGGVIMVLCAMGMSGWDFGMVDRWEDGVVVFDEQIAKLKMEVNVGEVIIAHGSTDQAVVSYEYDNRYMPQIDLRDDGTLSITTGKRPWYEFHFWFETAPTMRIEIPEDWKIDIDVKMNAGTVKLGDGDWGPLVDVELNAGAMSFGNVVMTEFRLELNAGALQARSIKCVDLTCRINAGGFEAKEIVCRKLDCKVSAGGVEVRKLDSQWTVLDVSAGGAELGLVGAKTDYVITVDKSAGSCNVGTQSPSAARRTLDIDISAGSVEVSFGK